MEKLLGSEHHEAEQNGAHERERYGHATHDTNKAQHTRPLCS